MAERLPYVWDYDLTAAQFEALLAGELALGRLDQDWAAARLLDYAPYPEIVQRMGFRALVAGWPRWRKAVRSASRRRGLDFLVDWLGREHPELLGDLPVAGWQVRELQVRKEGEVGTITRFEEIEGWQLGRELVGLVYSWSSSGEFSRDFGLRDQIRRAAVSIISNIAEGFESRTRAQFIEMLGRAKGSAGEVRAQLYVALDQGYVTQDQFDHGYDLARRTAGKIYNFMEYLASQANARRVRDEEVEYVAG